METSVAANCGGVPNCFLTVFCFFFVWSERINHGANGTGGTNSEQILSRTELWGPLKMASVGWFDFLEIEQQTRTQGARLVGLCVRREYKRNTPAVGNNWPYPSTHSNTCPSISSFGPTSIPVESAPRPKGYLCACLSVCVCACNTESSASEVQDNWWGRIRTRFDWMVALITSARLFSVFLLGVTLLTFEFCSRGYQHSVCTLDWSSTRTLGGGSGERKLCSRECLHVGGLQATGGWWWVRARSSTQNILSCCANTGNRSPKQWTDMEGEVYKSRLLE